MKLLLFAFLVVLTACEATLEADYSLYQPAGDLSVEESAGEVEASPTAGGGVETTSGRPVPGGGGAALASGQELFDRNCAACHGEEGRGGATYPGVIAGYSPIAPIVAQGRGQMPAFELTEDEVERIQAYLLELGPDWSAMTGLELFEARCASCHGEEGEGTGAGPQLRFEAPDYASWIVRNGRQSNRYDSDMPAFHDVTDAQLDEIWAWLSSFPRPTNGAGLYARFCANCHGGDAAGGVVGIVLRDESIDTDIVRTGSGGANFGARTGFMPAWSRAVLSETEVEAIEKYVENLEAF